MYLVDDHSGDINTTFFYRFAFQHRKRITIKKSIDDNNTELVKESDMVN